MMLWLLLLLGQDVRDDLNRPPWRTVFAPGRAIEPEFDTSKGRPDFIEVWRNGTPERLSLSSTGPKRVRASIPGGQEGDVLVYQFQGGERVTCFVTSTPATLKEISDSPKPHKKATPSPARWSDQSIYFVMVDRFFDGDPGNNRLGYHGFNRAEGFAAHGGDFQGLTKKLDYIQGLGATAIWVTPICQNFDAYHGYGAVNFLLPDRRLGTLADFREFVDAAHRRGMYVILDIICNHQGDLIYSESGDYSFTAAGRAEQFSFLGKKEKVLPVPHEFRNLDLFHHHGNVEKWEDPVQAVVGSFAGLDDFRTELPEIRKAMQKIYKYWIAQTDVDGFRVDTVKHVDEEFWTSFCPEIHRYAASIGKKSFFICGEYWSGEDPKVARCTGTKAGGPYLFDGMAHFPMYYTIQDVFAKDQPTARITERMRGGDLYHDDSLNVLFLDNHDVSRFLHNLGDGPARLKLALAFLHTARGIPCLYYGTEQGFSGRGDPLNREDMFDNPEWDGDNGPAEGDNFKPDHDLYRWIAKLGEIRRKVEPLRRGAFVPRWESADGPGIYAFSRATEQEEVLIVLNTAGAPRSAKVPLDRKFHPPGSVLVDLLSEKEAVQVAPGRAEVEVAMPARGARIFRRR